MKRLERWFAGAARPAAAPEPGPPPIAEAAPAAPRAPTPIEARLASLAPGRHVLVAAETPDPVPGLVLAAAAAGAASVTALSPERPADADARLAAAAESLALEPVAAAILAEGRIGAASEPPGPYARNDRAALWWRRERWDAPDLGARIGPVDLVVEPAGLATCEEPGRRLAELARSGARALLLHTPVLDPGAAPGFGPEALWHASTLDAARAAALDATLGAQGVALPQFARLGAGLTREAARAAGLAAPWWWFMTEGAVAALLADAGWTPGRRRRDGPWLLIGGAR